MGITSSLKIKDTLKISLGDNQMVTTTEYYRPSYLYCSETMLVNLSMNLPFLDKILARIVLQRTEIRTALEKQSQFYDISNPIVEGRRKGE